MTLAIFGATHATAESKYVMPRELVEHARDIGCAQIDDFYDVDGMIGPPYVYGYIPGGDEKSAAFWCQKTNGDSRQFFLAVMVAPGTFEPWPCPRLIPWHNRPGGLGITREPDESLENFRYLDVPRAKGPRGERAIHNAIQDSKPGQDTTFYCHERRWLVRSRH
jgi:hypothetical protein